MTTPTHLTAQVYTPRTPPPQPESQQRYLVEQLNAIKVSVAQLEAQIQQIQAVLITAGLLL